MRVEKNCTLTWGDGNIADEPLFADAAASDYHLESRDGRWAPAASAWVKDAAGSPCIDAGDPTAPFSGEPDPHGYRLNMGAFGNTPEASKSIRWPILGDANGDCSVNVLDLYAIRNRLNQDPATADNWIADVNRDGSINVLDLFFVRQNLNKRCP